MICPSCAQAHMHKEPIYLCPACGDDYTGAVAAKIIDSHTEHIRARLAQVEQERDALRSDYQNAPGWDERTLRARVERLERALRKIADGATGHLDRDGELAEIARAALEGK